SCGRECCNRRLPRNQEDQRNGKLRNPVTVCERPASIGHGGEEWNHCEEDRSRRRWLRTSSEKMMVVHPLPSCRGNSICRYVLLLISIISLSAQLTWGDVGILQILVQDSQRHPVRGIEIGISGIGGSQTTGDDGKALL